MVNINFHLLACLIGYSIMTLQPVSRWAERYRQRCHETCFCQRNENLRTLQTCPAFAAHFCQTASISRALLAHATSDSSLRSIPALQYTELATLPFHSKQGWVKFHATSRLVCCRPHCHASTFPCFALPFLLTLPSKARQWNETRFLFNLLALRFSFPDRIAEASLRAGDSGVPQEAHVICSTQAQTTSLFAECQRCSSFAEHGQAPGPSHSAHSFARTLLCQRRSTKPVASRESHFLLPDSDSGGPRLQANRMLCFLVSSIFKLVSTSASLWSLAHVCWEASHV